MKSKKDTEKSKARAEKKPMAKKSTRSADFDYVWQQTTGYVGLLSQEGSSPLLPTDEYYARLEHVLSRHYNAGKTFLALLKYLELLNIAYAHLAKHFNSFEAARNYLMAASTLRRVLRHERPICDAVRFVQVIANMRNGDEAFSIALDYAGMADWEDFRQHTLAPRVATYEEESVR